MTSSNAGPSLPPHLLSILCGLGGYGLFSVMDTFSKLLDGAVAIEQLIVFNAVATILTASVWCRLKYGRFIVWPDRYKLVLGHGLVAAIGVQCAFYGYRYMPSIADAYSISFSGPLLGVVLASLILGERLSWHRWLAVALGFCGVLIALQPDIQSLNPVVLFPIGAAFSFASGTLILRALDGADPPEKVMLLTNIVVLLILLPLAIFNPVGSQIVGADAATDISWISDPRTIATVLGCAISAVVAQLLIIMAFARGDASIVAPMNFTQIIWAVIFGLLIFNTAPRSTTVIGVCLVFLCTLYIIRDAGRVAASSAMTAAEFNDQLTSSDNRPPA
ncbi:MAG: DMT family transporter [Alphaproteobacteria bacterium]|nr:DMT family transporter [Alphaproteobacteria bacterium SS10]